MRKFLSLMLLGLVCSIGSVWGDETIFKWQYDGSTTYGDGNNGEFAISNTSGIGTIKFVTYEGKKTSAEGTIGYNASVTDSDLKPNITKGCKLGNNGAHLKISLASGTFQAGDIVYICGYNPIIISTGSANPSSTADINTKGVLTGSDGLSLGSSKSDYQISSLTLPANFSATSALFISRKGSSVGIAAIKVVRPALAPGAINFDPAAASVETGQSITLTSSNATTIYYQWAASAIDGEGDWSGAETYADNNKPQVPAYGSSNNVLSVKAHNDNGDTYGSATYTILNVKTNTTTAITAASKEALNADIKNGTAAGTLAATVTPSGQSALASPTIKWSSSATSVATIVEATGVVTLVGTGTTTITATYEGTDDYKASSDTYELTVTDTRKGITLSFASTSINDYNFDGETLTAPVLTVKDEDDNDVDLEDIPELTFSADKNDVVSVNASTGAIIAANINNLGTTTITAAFAGNSTYKAATSKTYTVTRAPYLRQVKFDNGFEAFIEEGTKKVKVYYMAGTDAPSQTGTIQKADGFTATVVGDNVVLTQTASSKVKTYTIEKTAVKPFEGTGKQTFTGTETYVASGYGWDGTKKWKFSKTDSDWSREAPGKTRLYFFVGAALKASFSFSTSRAVNIYVNGTSAGTDASDITLNADQLNMIEIQSNQTSGDGGLKDLTLTSPSHLLKMNAYGWTTLSHSSALDIVNLPDGLTAYEILESNIVSKVITPQEVTAEVVAAGKGLLLEGTANTSYAIPLSSETGDALSSNLLVGAPTGATLSGASDAFVFAVQGGVVGFYQMTNGTIPAGKAYLNLAGVTYAPGFFRIGNEEENATNLSNIEDRKDTMKFFENGQLLIKRDGIIYDVMGRVVR